MTRSAIRVGELIILLVLTSAITLGQEKGRCIIKQPKPAMPYDAGTLDAETSALFRVEFLANATLGKISLVKGTQIQRLDDLAITAVWKVTF